MPVRCESDTWAPHTKSKRHIEKVPGNIKHQIVDKTPNPKDKQHSNYPRLTS